MDAGVDFTKLKVAELKKLLKERGLSTSGNKPELIDRLQQATEGEVVSEVPEVTTDDSLSQDISLPVEEEDAKQVTEEKENTNIEQDNKAPQKQSSTIEKITLSGGSDGDKLAERAARFGAVSEEAKKALRAEKFGIVSDDVRKQKRAERFSVTSPGSDADKKAQRAARFGITASNGTATAKSGSITASSPEDAEKLRKRAERFGTNASVSVSQDDTGKLLKRKQRFGATTVGSSDDLEEKKRKRAERFKNA